MHIRKQIVYSHYTHQITMNLDNLYISVTRNVLQVENKCRIHLYLTSDYDVLRNFNVPCAHGIKLSLIYVFNGINLVISVQVLI